ncbi:DUF4221 family protein [Membranihabitans maritimus]|uniref:DUF4221 family protein n=1 Tax=Membranihabitans maritimus TaxID=2904244 RepID=UPI001F20334C|nr:DUF4221 family protein [Membranihabitans maritimus]
MKRAINIICKVLLIFIFSPCLVAQKEGIKDLNFFLNKSYELKLDIRSSNFSNTMYYKEIKGQPSLLLYNEKTRTIDFIDIKDGGKRYTSVKIPGSGEEGVIHPNGFFPVSDTSFIIPDVDFRLKVLDYQGKLVEEIPYDTIQDFTPYIHIVSSTAMGNSIFQTSIGMYMSHISNINDYNQGKSASDYIVAYFMDWENRKIRLTNFRFPDEYWDTIRRSMEFAWTYNNKERRFIIMPFDAPHILEFEEETDSLSRMIHLDCTTCLPFGNDGPLEWKLYSTSQFTQRRRDHAENLNIIYDPYRQLYYRLIWPGGVFHTDNPVQFMSGRMYPRFVLQVYDEDWQLKSSFLPEWNKYGIGQCFVAPDGFHMLVNHPDNPYKREGQLEVDVFDFSIFKK